MGPWRLLGGLWAAKSDFERILSDFGSHVGPMLEAQTVQNGASTSLKTHIRSKRLLEASWDCFLVLFGPILEGQIEHVRIYTQAEI